jgi:branched-subunit amino acid ABC-type transport system permease component
MHADIQLAIAGMAPGALLALLAMGLQIEFRSSGVLNLAHGAIATLAAYCCLYFGNHLGLPIGFAAVIGVLASTAVTGVFQVAVIRRMTASPVLAKIVATLGLMLLITAAIPVLFGSQQTPLIPLFGNGSYRLPFGSEPSPTTSERRRYSAINQTDWRLSTGSWAAY